MQEEKVERGGREQHAWQRQGEEGLSVARGEGVVATEEV